MLQGPSLSSLSSHSPTLLPAVAWALRKAGLRGRTGMNSPAICFYKLELCCWYLRLPLCCLAAAWTGTKPFLTSFSGAESS